MTLNHTFMNNKNTCLLTTVFPCPIEYLISFFDSLIIQDMSSFDVVIVNDGNIDLEELLTHYPLLSCHKLKAGDCPIENREILVKFAIQNCYDFAIFGDSDDKFSSNRMSESIKQLEYADIVVNEISTFTSTGVSKSNYISNRFKDSQRITLENILTFNIFGLSNTGVRVEALKALPLPFNRKLVALDWYIYSILLYANCSALFTNRTITYYRQHDENIAGLGTSNQETIKKSIKVKKAHYSALVELFGDGVFSKLRDSFAADLLMIESRLTTKNITNFPLWWEN